jgi:hypothetical protein
MIRITGMSIKITDDDTILLPRVCRSPGLRRIAMVRAEAMATHVGKCSSGGLARLPHGSRHNVR